MIAVDSNSDAASDGNIVTFATINISNCFSACSNKRECSILLLFISTLFTCKITASLTTAAILVAGNRLQSGVIRVRNCDDVFCMS